MSRAFSHGTMKPRALDPERARLFAERLGLFLCNESSFIWRGDCPFCGGHGTLTLWPRRAQATCGACGLDAWFGPAPERGMTAAGRGA